MVDQIKTHATYPQIKKLFAMNKKDFEIESKKPIYNDLDRFHYHTKLDPKLHYDILTKNRGDFIKIKKKFEG